LESPHHNAAECYASELLSSKMPDPEEQDSPPARANQTAVEALRTTFAVITKRLTPEVEPATIYLPYVLVSDPSTPQEKLE
jgi:hypothetical protein